MHRCHHHLIASRTSRHRDIFVTDRRERAFIVRSIQFQWLRPAVTYKTSCLMCLLFLGSCSLVQMCSCSGKEKWNCSDEANCRLGIITPKRWARKRATTQTIPMDWREPLDSEGRGRGWFWMKCEGVEQEGRVDDGEERTRRNE